MLIRFIVFKLDLVFVWFIVLLKVINVNFLLGVRKSLVCIVVIVERLKYWFKLVMIKVFLIINKVSVFIIIGNLVINNFGFMDMFICVKIFIFISLKRC